MNEFLKIVKTLDLEKIKEAVESGKYDIHADDDCALRWSAENGYLEVVKYLVEQGANIYVDDNYAFRWSAIIGHLKVVKYLVEQGADIHAKDECALKWSAAKGCIKVVKYLVEQGANIHANNDEALQMATRNGQLEVVKYLVEQGADIHTDNEYTFQIAARYGHLEVVKYLIEQAYMDDYKTLFKYKVLKQYIEVLQTPMHKDEFKVIYQDEAIIFHSLWLLSHLSVFFRHMFQSGLLENKNKCHKVDSQEEFDAIKRMFCEFKFKDTDEYWHEYYWTGKHFSSSKEL